MVGWGLREAYKAEYSKKKLDPKTRWIGKMTHPTESKWKYADTAFSRADSRLMFSDTDILDK